MMSDYQRLEDVNLVDFNIHDFDMDDGIRNLVRDLLFLSFPYGDVITRASCEGHLGSSRHQHPWVSLYYGYQENMVLQFLLDGYNNTHRVMWEASDRWLSPKAYSERCTTCNNVATEPITISMLESLYRSADELARYIFGQRYVIVGVFHKDRLDRTIRQYHSICDTFGDTTGPYVETQKMLEEIRTKANP